MSDWAKSTTKWFLPEDMPVVYAPKHARFPEKVEALAEALGLCTERCANGTLCARPLPCTFDHSQPDPLASVD